MVRSRLNLIVFKSRPTDVLKYLARYIAGGPISDRRLISDEDGVVTFWARSKDKGKDKRSEQFPLKGTEFVRRWTMHILPKGYTRSRAYGGYHGTKRAAYLDPIGICYRGQFVKVW